MAWVGRDFRDHQAPTPLMHAGPPVSILNTRPPCPGPIQPGLEHIQGQGIHNLPGQPLTAPRHSWKRSPTARTYFWLSDPWNFSGSLVLWTKLGRESAGPHQVVWAGEEKVSTFSAAITSDSSQETSKVKVRSYCLSAPLLQTEC